jgi:alkanesulfonate monooxygenase SsuD/methylene tetrahydromethanopterin reductase-like flavin-dependent oxidoreductase (luciferase family)
MGKLVAYGAETGRAIEPGEAGVLILTHVGAGADEARAVSERLLARSPIPQRAFAERSAIGDAGECVAAIERYAAAGCTKFVLFPMAPGDELLTQVERIGTQILPRFT